MLPPRAVQGHPKKRGWRRGEAHALHLGPIQQLGIERQRSTSCKGTKNRYARRWSSWASCSAPQTTVAPRGLAGKPTSPMDATCDRLSWASWQYQEGRDFGNAREERPWLKYSAACARRTAADIFRVCFGSRIFLCTGSRSWTRDSRHWLSWGLA